MSSKDSIPGETPRKVDLRNVWKKVHERGYAEFDQALGEYSETKPKIGDPPKPDEYGGITEEYLNDLKTYVSKVESAQHSGPTEEERVSMAARSLFSEENVADLKAAAAKGMKNIFERIVGAAYEAETENDVKEIFEDGVAVLRSYTNANTLGSLMQAAGKRHKSGDVADKAIAFMGLYKLHNTEAKQYTANDISKETGLSKIKVAQLMSDVPDMVDVGHYKGRKTFSIKGQVVEEATIPPAKNSKILDAVNDIASRGEIPNSSRVAATTGLNKSHVRKSLANLDGVTRYGEGSETHYWPDDMEHTLGSSVVETSPIESEQVPVVIPEDTGIDRDELQLDERNVLNSILGENYFVNDISADTGLTVSKVKTRLRRLKDKGIVHELEAGITKTYMVKDGTVSGLDDGTKTISEEAVGRGAYPIWALNEFEQDLVKILDGTEHLSGDRISKLSTMSTPDRSSTLYALKKKGIIEIVSGRKWKLNIEKLYGLKEERDLFIIEDPRDDSYLTSGEETEVPSVDEPIPNGNQVLSITERKALAKNNFERANKPDGYDEISDNLDKAEALLKANPHALSTDTIVYAVGMFGTAAGNVFPTALLGGKDGTVKKTNGDFIHVDYLKDEGIDLVSSVPSIDETGSSATSEVDTPSLDGDEVIGSYNDFKNVMDEVLRGNGWVSASNVKKDSRLRAVTRQTWKTYTQQGELDFLEKTGVTRGTKYRIRGDTVAEEPSEQELVVEDPEVSPEKTKKDKDAAKDAILRGINNGVSDGAQLRQFAGISKGSLMTYSTELEEEGLITKNRINRKTIEYLPASEVSNEDEPIVEKLVDEKHGKDSNKKTVEPDDFDTVVWSDEEFTSIFYQDNQGRLGDISTGDQYAAYLANFGEDAENHIIPQVTELLERKGIEVKDYIATGKKTLKDLGINAETHVSADDSSSNGTVHEVDVDSNSRGIFIKMDYLLKKAKIDGKSDTDAVRYTAKQLEEGTPRGNRQKFFKKEHNWSDAIGKFKDVYEVVISDGNPKLVVKTDNPRASSKPSGIEYGTEILRTLVGSDQPLGGAGQILNALTQRTGESFSKEKRDKVKVEVDYLIGDGQVMNSGTNTVSRKGVQRILEEDGFEDTEETLGFLDELVHYKEDGTLSPLKLTDGDFDGEKNRVKVPSKRTFDKLTDLGLIKVSKTGRGENINYSTKFSIGLAADTFEVPKDDVTTTNIKIASGDEMSTASALDLLEGISSLNTSVPEVEKEKTALEPAVKEVIKSKPSKLKAPAKPKTAPKPVPPKEQPILPAGGVPQGPPDLNSVMEELIPRLKHDKKIPDVIRAEVLFGMGLTNTSIADLVILMNDKLPEGEKCAAIRGGNIISGDKGRLKQMGILSGDV